MAFDAFLKLVNTNGTPVPGESLDAVHKGEIQILGYNFNVTNHGSLGSATGGAGAGKATFGDFQFSTNESKASLSLFQACASGNHFQKAIVALRKAGGERNFEFMQITMSPVFVSSFNSGGSSGDDVPHDDVHLSYGAIHFQYTPQKPDGSADTPTTAGWDLKLNKQA